MKTKSNLSEMQSRLMWQRFIDGDNDAYAWIYKTYVQTLIAFGRRFIADKETVKDCVQDVFTLLYRNRRRLTVPDNCKLYLMISLKNICLRTLQRQTPPVHALAPDELAEFTIAPAVEDEYIDNEDIQRQNKLIERLTSILSARQREIIYYRYIQEFEFNDICRLMNLNYQSAKNLIQRALKKMREAV